MCPVTLYATITVKLVADRPLTNAHNANKATRYQQVHVLPPRQ